MNKSQKIIYLSKHLNMIKNFIIKFYFDINNKKTPILKIKISQNYLNKKLLKLV